MEGLSAAERKVLNAGLLAAEHINIYAAWLDLRLNEAAHWERFHTAATVSAGLRAKAGLSAHTFEFGCCAPSGIDDQGFIRTTGIIVYGLNPIDQEKRTKQQIARHPPKRPKNLEEARRRDQELQVEANKKYERMYEGAIG